MSFDGIEKKSADANAALQLKGAAKQMRAAAAALENALRLGGDVSREQGLDDMLSALARVQQLGVVVCYRQKVPFDKIAEVLRVPAVSVVAMLGQHFEQEPQLSQDWLLAERDIQQRTGPGETPR